jgi:hypothetical protein
MKTWWLVVRHADPAVVAQVRCDCDDCRGKPPGGHYPSEGFAVMAFDDEARAKLYAATSTTAHDRYEAVPVARIPGQSTGHPP